MPIPIQNARVTEQLVRSFELKGRAEFVLDSTIVPVVIADDIVTRPGATAGTRQRDSTAVAAQLGFVGVRPSISVDTKVLGVDIVNQSGGLSQYEIMLVTDNVFFTLATSITSTDGLFIVNRDDPNPALGNNSPETATRIFDGTRAALLGNRIARFILADDTQVHFRFTTPPLLFGAPLSAAAAASNSRAVAIVLWMNTVNLQCDCVWSIEEQPKP